MQHVNSNGNGVDRGPSRPTPWPPAWLKNWEANIQAASSGVAPPIPAEAQAVAETPTPSHQPAIAPPTCAWCNRWGIVPRYWESVYGVVVCGRCHPPAFAALVKRWLEPKEN